MQQSPTRKSWVSTLLIGAIVALLGTTGLAADAAPSRPAVRAWTVEFRVVTSTPGGIHRYAQWATIAGGATGWYVSISAAGVIVGWLDRNDGSTAILSSRDQGYGDSQWHRIRVVHDGSTVRLYVDGALEGATPTAIAAGKVTRLTANPSGDSGLSGGLKGLMDFASWDTAARD